MKKILIPVVICATIICFTGCATTADRLAKIWFFTHHTGGDETTMKHGGIRRGGDVVKALALGARAVMIGRAYLWGLAAAGQPGVENVLDIMRAGIESALLGLGRASTSKLSAEDVLVPSGFTRGLGVGDPVSSRG